MPNARAATKTNNAHKVGMVTTREAKNPARRIIYLAFDIGANARV